jgi:hypothetical protein
MNTVNLPYKETTINIGEVIVCEWNNKKKMDTAVWEENKGLLLQYESKGHPCTGTEALYRPYGP